ESITISARASTQRDEKQPLEIRIRLIGEYRDGIIELTYKNVQSYLLEGMRDIAGHGDWLEDEVKVNRHDQLKHKVTVTNGTFVIEAEDIEFKWKPLPRYSEQP
ncbi:MAG TPA: hypothetical protein VMC85_18345, partial [Desulfomonilaceae bacterium]|nr:hypothetical protein [Desulfomonilaceae bacterium]